MKTRLITSTYIVIGLILAFASRLFTPFVFDLVIGVLAIMGAVEVGRAFERGRAFNNIYLVGSFPALLYVLFAVCFNYGYSWEYYLIMFFGLMFAFFVLTFLLTLVLKKQTARELSKYQVEYSKIKYALIKSINTAVILVYPTVLFASFYLLNHFFDLNLSSNVVGSPFDYYLLLTVFLVTMITDSLAMIVGSALKGPKLCPRISPKKTISGAVGGLLGGVLAAFVVYWLFTINQNFVTAFNEVASIWTVVIFGVLGSVISQIGDIFASYIKRRARIKDYGTIFPGHGGVMDRVDGLIFNAAFVLIVTLILL